eukprot:2276460-Rhodomonas_salina.3
MSVHFRWDLGGKIAWDYHLRSVPASLYQGSRIGNVVAQSAMEIASMVFLALNVLLILHRVWFAIRTVTAVDLLLLPGIMP